MHAHLYPIHYVFWSEHRKKRTLFKSKIDDWVAGSVDFDIMNRAKSHYFALFAPEKRAENLLFSPESVQWKFAMPSFFSHFVENATFCCSRASCAHFDQTIEIKLEYFCYFSLNCTSIDFEWKKIALLLRFMFSLSSAFTIHIEIHVLRFFIRITNGCIGGGRGASLFFRKMQ